MRKHLLTLPPLSPSYLKALTSFLMDTFHQHSAQDQRDIRHGIARQLKADLREDELGKCMYDTQAGIVIYDILLGECNALLTCGECARKIRNHAIVHVHVYIYIYVCVAKSVLKI